jgi:hypothetical protein
MPVDFALGGVRWVATLSGRVTMADLQAVIDRLSEAESRAETTPDRIVDLSPVTTIELGFTEVAALARARKAVRPRNPFRSAIVAVSALQQGYARMFQTLNDHPLITVRVFDSIEAAEAWLDAPR